MVTQVHTFELSSGEAGNRVIRGQVELPTTASPASPCPFVLLVHGFKGFYRWGFFPELSRRLAAAGLAAVSFNLSGSGVGPDLETIDDDDGFEANTYSRELEDIRVVRESVEAAKWSSIHPQRGGILGHSRGGGMAILHASQRPGLLALVTWSAIDRVDRWDPESLPLWRSQGYLPVLNGRTGQTHRIGLGLLEDVELHSDQLDIIGAAAACTVPALLFHGLDDEAVPPLALERLAQAFPAGKATSRPLPGTGHTFDARHPLEQVPPALEQVLTETVTWFRQHLADPGPKGSDPS